MSEAMPFQSGKILRMQVSFRGMFGPLRNGPIVWQQYRSLLARRASKQQTAAGTQPHVVEAA